MHKLLVTVEPNAAFNVAVYLNEFVNLLGDFNLYSELHYIECEL